MRSRAEIICILRSHQYGFASDARGRLSNAREGHQYVRAWVFGLSQLDFVFQEFPVLAESSDVEVADAQFAALFVTGHNKLRLAHGCE